jgi:hypothetical protein
MGNRYATGKHAIAFCDRCGFRFKLKQLKSITIKTKSVNILVCSDCFEPDQPQLQVGMYPVNDPQALRNPRPDLGLFESGPGGDGGSRVIQWGFDPVGLNNPFDLPMPNDLVAEGAVGTVTVNTN